MIGHQRERREALLVAVERDRDDLQRALATLTAFVQHKARGVRSSLHHARESLDLRRKVQRHPWAWVGGAAAIGLWLGLRSWLRSRPF